MTRQLETLQEEKTSRRNLQIIKAVEYELVGAIAHSGGRLHGLAVTFEDFQTRLTLKAEFGGKYRVTFIVNETLADTLLQGVRGAYGNTLRWKRDKYPPKHT